eukprot:TRINITY_DN1205_c1_g1_i17.p1 TRINITY_DN1205_c1_g1~~TRINITY_DN1205_c1_g1_i17.p1  ORF type:complete len:252 (+),score=100.67 TRINITY_DN1205_c1_g1_i17:1831-2586(+)
MTRTPSTTETNTYTESVTPSSSNTPSETMTPTTTNSATQTSSQTPSNTGTSTVTPTPTSTPDCFRDLSICDDQNECTSDLCHPINGCFHIDLNNIPCTLTDKCLINGKCIDSVCEGEPKCDDGIGCTIDLCDSNTGICSTEDNCVDIPIDEDPSDYNPSPVTIPIPSVLPVVVDNEDQPSPTPTTQLLSALGITTQQQQQALLEEEKVEKGETENKVIENKGLNYGITLFAGGIMACGICGAMIAGVCALV